MPIMVACIFAPILLGSCLFGQALATPAQQKHNITIDNIRRVKYSPEDAPLLAAMGGRRPHKSKVSPSSVNFYIFPVYVGGSNTPLDVAIFTAITDFFLLSDLEPADDTIGDTLYNTSTGTPVSGESFNYQDALSGPVYTDELRVGSATVQNAVIEAVNNTANVSHALVSGFVGFAFPHGSSCSPNPCPSLFESLMPTLFRDIFTTAFKPSGNSTMTFGYIDHKLHSSPITYVPVNSSSAAWSISPGGYSIGTGTPTAGNLSANGEQYPLESGSDALYLPPDVVADYYNDVLTSTTDSTGDYYYLCSEPLPAFNIEIGGPVYTITGAILSDAGYPVNSTTCYGPIQPVLNMYEQVSLGNPFLESVYAVWQPSSRNGPQIGFAQPA